METKFAYTFGVGENPQITYSSQPVDQSLSKTFRDYQISLSYPMQLKAADLSIGKAVMKFNILDATGQTMANIDQPSIW